MVAALVTTIEAEDRTKAAVASAQRNFNSLGKRGSASLAKIATGAKVAAASLAAIGVVAVGIGLKIASEFLASAKEIQKFSDITGVGVEALQTWGKVAELSGGNLEHVTDAVREMNLRLAEAAALQSGPAVDALNLLGVSLADLGTKTPEEKFALLRDRISEIEDPARRAFIAEELLGGSSEHLAGVLSLSAEAFREQTQAMLETGSVMDEETIRASQELNKTIALVSNTIKGLFLRAFILALPHLQNFANFLLKKGVPALEQFAATLRLDVAPNIANAARVLTKNLNTALDFVFRILRDDVLPTGGRFVEFLGKSLNGAVQVASHVLGVDFAGAFQIVIASIQEALQKVGEFVLGLDALAGVKEIVINVATKIDAALPGDENSVQNLAESLFGKEPLKFTLFGNDVVLDAKDKATVLGGIVTALGIVIATQFNTILGLGAAFLSGIAAVVFTPLGALVAAAVIAVLTLTGKWGEAWDIMKSVAETAYEQIVTLFAGFGVDLPATLEDLITALLNVIGVSREQIATAWTDAWAALRTIPGVEEALLGFASLEAAFGRLVDTGGRTVAFLVGLFAAQSEVLGSFVEGLEYLAEKSAELLGAVLGEAFRELAIFIDEHVAPTFRNLILILGILFGNAVAAFGIGINILNQILTDHFEEVQNIVINILDILLTPIEILILTLEGLTTFMLNVFLGNWQAAWDSVQQTQDNITDALLDVLRSFRDIVLDLFTIFGVDLEKVVRDTWEAVKGFFSDAFAAILSLQHTFDGTFEFTLGEHLRSVGAAIIGAWEFIKGRVGIIWGGIKADAFTAFSAIQTFINGVGEAIASSVSFWWTYTSGVQRGAVNIMISVAEGFANAWVRAINTVVGAWNNLSFTLPPIPLPFGLGTVPGFTVQTPNLGFVRPISIPRLQAGGIVTRPTTALIGEAGPEAIIPLNRAAGLGGPTVTVINNIQGSLQVQDDLRRFIEKTVYDSLRLRGAAINA